MEKKLTKSDFFWAFIRSNFLQGSWNMERMQALGRHWALLSAWCQSSSASTRVRNSSRP